MKKPSPSMIVSIGALVVALGGTGYAAATINSDDVQNNTLTGKDIKQKSLTGKDIQDGSLKAKDLKKGTIPPAPRWLLVDRNGAIVSQSGGFKIRTAYDIVNNSGAAVPGGALGNVYIDANEPLDDNGIVVSIALQNTLDQNNDTIVNGRAPGPDANPEFSGEITATMCGITGIVGCAPTGANTINTFVVSPRMSDGSLTVTGDGTPANPNTHKRFYVIITGDSSDYVAPAA